jgi:PAS domain S-box-containing protein
MVEKRNAASDHGGSGIPEDFVVLVDADWKVAVWSTAARRLLGYTAEEITGRAAAELLALGLPQSARQHILAVTPWTSQVVLRRMDGERIQGRLQAMPLVDGAGARLWLLSGAAAPYTPRPAEAEAAELWDRTLAQHPLPVAIYDDRNKFVTCNAAMSMSMGRTAEEMRGLTLLEIAPGEHVEEIDRLQRQVLRTGEMVYREWEPSRASGELHDHAWSIFITPLKDQRGTVQGFSATVIDTTEQYWARRHLAVLNDASLRIGSTLDVDTTAEELAEVAVAGFADFATVDLLASVSHGDEPERLSAREPIVFRRAAARSVLPGTPESVLRPGDSGTYPAESPPAVTLRSGRGSWHSIGDPALRSWLSSNPARSRQVRQYGVHSVMMVPLRTRGLALGSLQLIRHRTAEPFGEDDLLLAEEIAARAAVSIDNARRYTRERRTALALQRSLLPARMPALSAVDLAYRYLPAGAGSEVGGDWFDAIPLSGERVALVVGDVVGHGVHASATMARLRTAVQTLADVDLPPDELLTQLDDLVLRLDRNEGPDARGRAGAASGQVGATCLYAVYDPVSRRCQLARAGHPPPAQVAPDGTVRFLDVPSGPPLGLGGLPFESAEVELDGGSLLALYTDGLVEGRDRDLDTGLDLLRDALRDPAPDLEGACDRVLRKVKPASAADDIVLLLARTRALGDRRVRTWQLPPDPAAVPEARLWAGEQLGSWGLADMAYSTELIVSELVTNAIRYGSAPIQLRLIRGGALVCEVSDGNSAAPHLRRARVFDEGGRGLLLVAQVAERWGSRQTPAGKTIWAEQPLPEAPPGSVT